MWQFSISLKVFTLKRDVSGHFYTSIESSLHPEEVKSPKIGAKRFGLFRIGPRASSKWPEKLSCEDNKDLRFFLLGSMKFRGIYWSPSMFPASGRSNKQLLKVTRKRQRRRCDQNAAPPSCSPGLLVKKSLNGSLYYLRPPTSYKDLRWWFSN